MAKYESQSEREYMNARRSIMRRAKTISKMAKSERRLASDRGTFKNFYINLTQITGTMTRYHAKKVVDWFDTKKRGDRIYIPTYKEALLLGKDEYGMSQVVNLYNMMLHVRNSTTGSAKGIKEVESLISKNLGVSKEDLIAYWESKGYDSDSVGSPPEVVEDGDVEEWEELLQNQAKSLRDFLGNRKQLKVATEQALKLMKRR